MLIAHSPLLLHICCHLVCSYTLSSLLFFGRTLVLATSVADSGDRMRWFASLHSCSAMIILMLQLFATGAISAAEFATVICEQRATGMYCNYTYMCCMRSPPAPRGGEDVIV